MGEEMIRRVIRSEIKSINEKDFTVDVTMSDETIDRYKEVIQAKAWKKRLGTYKAHPILLSSHDYRGLRNQIGEAEKIGVKNDKLHATLKYYAGEGNPEADWAWVLASKGVAAYSVGFIRHAGFYIDPEVEKEDDEEYEAYRKAGVRYVYTDVELLENSHVTVPANPACLQDSFEQGMVVRSLGEQAYPLLAELEAALKSLAPSKPKEKLLIQNKAQLEDYEYLLHHIEKDDNGKEIIHHCFVFDHIANLFQQEHIVIIGGKVFYKGKKVKDGIYHVISGLEPTQDICWSDVEAEENKIAPKEMVAGMKYKQKAKVW